MLPSFYSITSEEYKNALKNKKTDNCLFFLTDTKEIYKGTELYSKSVEFVSEFPSNPAINRLYINSSTYEGKIYDGIEWVTVIKNQGDYNNSDSGSAGTFDRVTLVDKSSGYEYIVGVQDGELYCYCRAISIRVSKQPNKTTYNSLEDRIDTTGMIVEAVCEDGSIRTITRYTYTDKTIGELGLQDGDEVDIEITYKEEENVFTSFFTIRYKAENLSLIDFEYDEKGGTYTLTDWKGTYNGEDSTELIIPNNSYIIL